MKNGYKDMEETQRLRSVPTIGIHSSNLKMTFPSEDKHTLDTQDSPTSETVLPSGKGVIWRHV